MKKLKIKRDSSMWAIIGGSGFDEIEGFEHVEELSLETPFGQASSGFKRI